MSSVNYLTSSNFSIQQGSKGLLLCNNIQGISLVLFHSRNCPSCIDFVTLFKQLPNLIDGVTISMFSVDSGISTIRESQQTITPIRYTPYIMLYYNGKPYMQYNGEPTGDGIMGFIDMISNRIQSKQSFINSSSSAGSSSSVGFTESKGTQNIMKNDCEQEFIPYCDPKTGVCYIKLENME